jgi:hypothetical protein
MPYDIAPPNGEASDCRALSELLDTISIRLEGLLAEEAHNVRGVRRRAALAMRPPDRPSSAGYED